MQAGSVANVRRATWFRSSVVDTEISDRLEIHAILVPKDADSGGKAATSTARHPGRAAATKVPSYASDTLVHARVPPPRSPPPPDVDVRVSPGRATISVAATLARHTSPGDVTTSRPQESA